MVDYRDLPPISESENVELPSRLRQTLARRLTYCPRSAYLYMKFNGGAPSHDLNRGSAAHDVFERCLREQLNQGEPQIPADVAKRIADEVIAEYPLLPQDADAVRLMAFHYAEATVLDLSEVAAFEQTFLLDIGGMTISCKPDRVLMREVPGTGLVVDIGDFKTQLNMAEIDKLTTDRPDGSKAWTELQGMLYTLAVVYGIPEGGMAPIGANAALIRVSQIYPRYLYDTPDGIFLGQRSGTIRPVELPDWMAYMESKVEQFLTAHRTRKWQAIKGSHCVECPCKPECPLPAALRDHAGTIETMEQAQEAAELIAAQEDDIKMRKKELKTVAGEVLESDIRFGTDQVWSFTPVQKKNTDREGLIAAAKRAAETGAPFNENDYVKPSTYTSFQRRTLRPEELKEKDG